MNVLTIIAFGAVLASARVLQDVRLSPSIRMLPTGVSVTGTMEKWYPITLTFDGPLTSETTLDNPFLNYRMNITFTHFDSKQKVHVPGYFAADGNAANTGASQGNKWRAHFTPSLPGKYEVSVSFRTGQNIAISLKPLEGKPISFNGTKFMIDVQDQATALKSKRDHRGKGILHYVGQRYLRFDNGEYFLKGGADSPENLLGYKDFDGTFSQTGGALKHFKPHLNDWKLGDPTWKNGKGKGIIGAINYLASTGANAFSFLTFNVNGDGKDVWPFIKPSEFLRYDVSKLDQWNIVFTHADTLGMFLHFKTQEIENDVLLDQGELGISRKLYYRELVARFAHHHALNWNLGEENDIWKQLGDSSQENVKKYIKYFHAIDPYKHPVVIHSFPGQHEDVYGPLLGKEADLDGMSLQTHWWNVHAMTLDWSSRSSGSGKPWVVCNDEQNSALDGVLPDGPNSNRVNIRRFVLWGNLMAGGGGVEYYFGYDHAHNDLNANDWRSRDLAWSDINVALTFFHQYTPFTKMMPATEYALSSNVYVFAAPQDTLVYFFRDGNAAQIKIPEGSYSIHWFNPRTGVLSQTANKTISGPQEIWEKSPDLQDWAMLLRAF